MNLEQKQELITMLVNKIRAVDATTVDADVEALKSIAQAINALLSVENTKEKRDT